MRKAEDLVTAPPSVSLQDANTMLWDHRLDILPVVRDDGTLESLVPRADYLLHKKVPERVRRRGEAVPRGRRHQHARLPGPGPRAGGGRR
jgi:CBS-domain-containing membrane protein